MRGDARALPRIYTTLNVDDDGECTIYVINGQKHHLAACSFLLTYVRPLVIVIRRHRRRRRRFKVVRQFPNFPFHLRPKWPTTKSMHTLRSPVPSAHEWVRVSESKVHDIVSGARHNEYKIQIITVHMVRNEWRNGCRCCCTQHTTFTMYRVRFISVLKYRQSPVRTHTFCTWCATNEQQLPRDITSNPNSDFSANRHCHRQ